MNRATLIGYVGENPKTSNLKNDGKVVNFTLATSEHFKDKEGNKQTKTEWHKVTAWNKLAEIVEKNVVKGSQLCVEGKIETRSYDNKDGVKVYTTEIIASTVEFLGSKKSNDDTTSNAPQSTANNSTANKASTTTNTPASFVPSDVDDDLPF